MAELLLNNKTNAKDLICFDSIPNIVTVVSNTTTRTKANATYDFTNTDLSSLDNTAALKINDYTVTATPYISQANGRRFFIPTTKESLALNVMNALKNIPQLNMMYNFIYQGGKSFTLVSKGYGASYTITSEVQGTLTVQISGTYTSTDDNALRGDESSKIYMDIYYTPYPQKQLGSDTETPLISMNYVTTLEKEFYDDKTSFNISPVLSTLAMNNHLFEYILSVYASVDGEYKNIGKTKSNFCTRGYLVNQGDKYIDFSTVLTYIPALNVKTGTNTSSYNKSTLYVYDNNIPLTFYYGNSINTVSYVVNYLDSDETGLYSENKTKIISASSEKNVLNFTVDLDEEKLRDSFYIDLRFDFGTLRYTVINPPYANVENNRVYWYNSYGGISFFDFTAEKKTERKSDLMTYHKTLLDYYSTNEEQQEIVYSKDVTIDVTLTTHLMDANGLYQLYDLQESYTAWVMIDNVKYYIIVSEVKVEEPSDGIYKATVKYKYSLIDSFN